MKFIIESSDIREDILYYDFSYEMVNAVRYHQWYRNNQDMSYSFSRDSLYGSPGIPIGSIPYVHNYMKYVGIPIPPPNYIPAGLFRNDYLNREIKRHGSEKDVHPGVFIKSLDKLKSYCGIYEKVPVGNYLISEIVEFSSEYRCFVYRNELVGLKHYCGDFDKLPDVGIVKRMIVDLGWDKLAYTIDVGLIGGRTSLIEVHDFYSIGLYGFNNYQILPYMFGGWWNQYYRKSIHDI